MKAGLPDAITPRWPAFFICMGRLTACPTSSCAQTALGRLSEYRTSNPLQSSERVGTPTAPEPPPRHSPATCQRRIPA